MAIDEFGLSSGDEADLLELETEAKNSTSSSLKRPRPQSSTFEEPAAKAVHQEQSNGDGEVSPVLDIAHRVLRETFKLSSFRLKQAQAISRVLDGESAMVVFPTGGGKSLCYQIPGVAFKFVDDLQNIRQGHAEHGITLIVSPLIALMKDQVDALRRRNVNAGVLDSTRTREEYLDTVDAMREGKLDVLYCAPERLNNEGFVGTIAHVKGGVRLLAIDEAHCISEWGHAFRPDYLKVARFAKEVQAERVLCLTATATPTVAADVCRAFNIPKEGLFRTSSYRSNLKLQAFPFSTKEESYPHLIKFLKDHPGSTIIYVTLQKHAEDLAMRLRKSGVKAEHFHAGMKPEEKTILQDKFMCSDNLVMTATIAFGMGIDKANIRNVIHYDIPRSLEGYSQEIGRAGRDGLPSHCVLYLCAEDFHLRESFARGDLPSKSSVTGLLHYLFNSKPTIVGGNAILELNLGQMGKDFDIKPQVLKNILAQLELQFHLLRESTPKYNTYQYKTLASTESDKSTAAKAIRKKAKLAKIWTHIDIDAASRSERLERNELVKKLNEWHDSRWIVLDAKGVVNVYKIIKPFPTATSEKKDIVDALYHGLEAREQQDLGRMQQVQDLITGKNCFAYTLARHFGDALPDEKKECGQCTWCETHQVVTMASQPQVSWNSAAFRQILKTVPDRDDPRYLTRIAFGITSPRSTTAKLGRDPIFGSMEDHSFTALLAAFTKVCQDGHS